MASALLYAEGYKAEHCVAHHPASALEIVCWYDKLFGKAASDGWLILLPVKAGCEPTYRLNAVAVASPTPALSDSHVSGGSCVSCESGSLAQEGGRSRPQESHLHLPLRKSRLANTW